jgi:hypothetical protein
MSTKSNARRLRASSEFTCSHCGGHEAYTCHGQSTIEHYLLSALMVQSARCCDCDNLCYAFPVRLSSPILSGSERTALARQPHWTEPRTRPALRKRPTRTTGGFPTAQRDFRSGTAGWAVGA